MRLPGAAMRCTAQSNEASASAAGDNPAVKRATMALTDLSTTSANAVDP